MFEELDVGITTNATAEELWQRWLELCVLSREAGKTMVATGEQGTSWDEYERCSREYYVLSAWTNVVYSAYVFLTYGVDCAAFTAHDSVG